ncbi:MAG TPA: endonuclease/exonuclease/phosphatase family protein [Drouetiella sp.]
MVLLRGKLVIFTWLLTFVLVTLPMVPFFITEKNRPASKDSVKVRILQANLWGGKNRNFDGVTENVERFSPDVFVVSENTKMWSQYFERHLPDYKYKIVENLHGGIAVYSKLPLENAHVRYFGEKMRPRVETVVKCNGNKFFLIAAHPMIPKMMKMRNDEFKELAASAAQSDIPVILAGDLNCSPWSYYFSKLLDDGRLHDSERGFGIHGSWPAFVLKNIAYMPCIPIDHFLVSDGVTVLSRELGDRDGSDHLPVFMEVEIAKNRVN